MTNRVTIHGAEAVERTAREVSDALIHFVGACRALRTVQERPDGTTEITVPLPDLRTPLMD